MTADKVFSNMLTNTRRHDVLVATKGGAGSSCVREVWRDECGKTRTITYCDGKPRAIAAPNNVHYYPHGKMDFGNVRWGQ